MISTVRAMTFLRKQFGCVKTVVLCFFGEWRDEDTRLRNPHPERNRIQQTFGSRLQPTVYTAMAYVALFHFAHSLGSSVKVHCSKPVLDCCWRD